MGYSFLETSVFSKTTLKKERKMKADTHIDWSIERQKFPEGRMEIVEAKLNKYEKSL